MPTQIAQFNSYTTQTYIYIYVKIAKRTVMALLQQPTEERMVPTFLTAYVWGINIVSRHRYT